MAIIHVGDASTATANVATFDITLPAGLQEGDLVIVAVCNTSDASDTHYPVTTSGYTEIADLYANDTRDLNATVSYKYMGATPDTTVTCTGRTGSADYGCFGSATVFRGVRAVNPFDVPIATATGINSALPDAPAVTPLTLGSRISILGFSTQENDATLTHPTGYTDASFVRSSVQYGGIIAEACKLWGGDGEEDPPAWTDINTSALECWAAVTMALHPEEHELELIASLPALQPVIYGAGALITELPALQTLIGAQGNSAALIAELPAFKFIGSLGQHGDLAAVLPALQPLLHSGGGVVAELPVLEPLFTGYAGSTAALSAALPTLEPLLRSGARISIEVPTLAPLLGGTVGTAARLFGRTPTLVPLFTGTVGKTAQLVATLPPLRPVITAEQAIVSGLVAQLPTWRPLLTGHPGVLGSLIAELPALEPLLTARHDVTGELIAALPALRVLLEASQSGRFDTTTAAQLANVILQYRRPS